MKSDRGNTAAVSSQRGNACRSFCFDNNFLGHCFGKSLPGVVVYLYIYTVVFEVRRVVDARSYMSMDVTHMTLALLVFVTN